MAYEIGFVDNTGSEGLAHWQMLDTIRRFACGYGTLTAAVFSGTGNGTLSTPDTHPATISETWTIECTNVDTVGAEVWSVTGSVSRAQAAATTGVVYDNGFLSFQVAAGSTAFAVGDKWTVAATQGALSAAGQAWTQLRYLTPSDGTPRELILKGVGLSGTEEIYIGFRTYHDVNADYYNMSSAAFTGYVDANIFASQPGYIEMGLCAHNQRIDYWLAVNGQRIAFGLKVGTPVYEVGYVGKFLPYATPGQYPYPMACIGTLKGTPATRYSDVSSSHTCGVKGTATNNWPSSVGTGRFRDLLGRWTDFRTLAWTADWNNGAQLRRDTGGYYNALSTMLMSGAGDGANDGNIWGELDGIRYISGFNNVTENTLTIDGVEHVVMQDVFRTGIGDYFLLELR